MTPRRALRWLAPAVIVLAVVVAIRMSEGSDTVERDGLTFASPSLARNLERSGPGPDVRVLDAFEDRDGVMCRTFVARAISGIACAERGGWHLRVIRSGISLDDPAALKATEIGLRLASTGMRARQ